MNDPTLIQVIALVLFAACLIHSWNTEGRRAAQQWFLTGYLFALLLINLLVVTGQIAYNSLMLVVGAAPSVGIMLYPAIFYLAYVIARTMVAETNLPAMAYVIFLLTPALMLPLDVTALSMGWWTFPSESYDFLNRVPFYLPFAWGIIAASFFWMVGRIRRIRFRGSGQLFAMIIATPVLAAVVILLVAVVQVLVDGIVAVGGELAPFGLLALLYIILPLALSLNLPRWRRL